MLWRVVRLRIVLQKLKTDEGSDIEPRVGLRGSAHVTNRQLFLVSYAIVLPHPVPPCLQFEAPDCQRFHTLLQRHLWVDRMSEGARPCVQSVLRSELPWNDGLIGECTHIHIYIYMWLHIHMNI